MAADHEFLLPGDTALPDMKPATEPVGLFELTTQSDVTVPSMAPTVIPYVDVIGSDNGDGGGGSCEDTRPDTGMLYPRG